MLVFVTLIWGAYIYHSVYGLGWFKTFYYTLSLFFADVKTPSDVGVEIKEISWVQNIFIPASLALMVLLWAVVSIYLELIGKKLSKLWRITRCNNIFVIGLGEGNRAYIDSELKIRNRNIIAIESDHGNPYIEHYSRKILVEVADAKQKDLLFSLGISKAKHVVISSGDDITNIDIAKQLLEMNKQNKIFLHLTDRSLRGFHKENGVLSGNNIRVYSYYEESARELFDNHDIDGMGMQIISSHKEYALAVVGNTPLAHEVIAQACIVGQLPNKNRLTIYCIDRDMEGFKHSVELEFRKILLVPNVTLEYVALDHKTNSFYESDIWNKEIANIILCSESDQTNLDIATNLTQHRFVDAVVDGTMYSKMHIAMSQSTVLGNSIDKDNKLFTHMHIFGQTKVVSDREYIISEERDAQAIAVDYIYSSIKPLLENYGDYGYTYCKYDTNWNCIADDYDNSKYMNITDNQWKHLGYFHKESNRAVADHMKYKLKYMGLEISQSTDTKESLFIKNKKIFEDKLNNFTDLARCEHDRWMAFHYLQGYSTMPFVSKEDKEKRKEELLEKRLHMCLVEFNAFKEKAEKLTALGYDKGIFEGYDVMIVEHIPQIVTYAGYELVEAEDA